MKQLKLTIEGRSTDPWVYLDLDVPDGEQPPALLYVVPYRRYAHRTGLYADGTGKAWAYGWIDDPVNVGPTITKVNRRDDSGYIIPE